MNFEILKNISESFYIDFKDITSGISDRSENIYNKFRMAIEELLKQINNSYQYVSDGERFYNRIINNIEFQSDMINKYKCDSKIMKTLTKVQKLGNDVTHNTYKVFDEKDVRNTFFRMLLLARKVLQFERDINSFDFNVNQVNDEFDRLLESKNVNTVPVGSKDDFQNEIISLDNELVLLFSDFYNNVSAEKKVSFILKFKELISITLNYILSFNTKYNSLEDLKIGEYSGLYKSYNNIDNLLSYENHSDVIASINDITFIIKNILETKFSINVLDWLLDIEQKNKVIEYEDSDSQIADAIDRVAQTYDGTNDINGAVYYVESQRQFISKGRPYYVVNLKKAINDASKSNTVYSIAKLPSNYALEVSLKSENIELLGNKTPIFVISSYKVAIRPCEIKNLIYAINGIKVTGISKKSNFYITLMNYIQKNGCTLFDILSSNENSFNDFVSSFDSISANDCHEFIEAMKKARSIIIADEFESGSNLLKYFTNNLVNSVLRDQLSSKQMNGLFFLPGSYRFDRNPYSFSLYRHNIKVNELYQVFPKDEFEEDIIVRKLTDKMVEKETLFIDLLKYEPSTEEKIMLYNQYLNNNYDKTGEMGIIDNYVYRIDFVDTMKNILSMLSSKANNSSNGYYNDLLNKRINGLNLDSDLKEKILNNSFNNSKLSMILGEAGSGKTELLCNYYTNIFKDKKILFLSNTHTCKNNMERRVKEKCGLSDDFVFKTIKSVSSKRNMLIRDFDVVIIDECKSISNKDIEIVLNRVKCDYLIMAGDVGQIDAIDLGNWFDVATKMINEKCVFELYENHRTNEKSLKTVWNKVRNHDEDTLKYLLENNYIEKINKDIFNPKSDSEIILCLNYNGTYGITSINSYFQHQNPNPAFVNNLDTYKVGNPVVFNENANNNDLYSEYIYNNLQGEIREIKEDEEYLNFIIHVDAYIPSSEECVISSNEVENWSNIKIKFRKYTDKPDEDNEDEYLSPFTVTYALSIHKAQGLEYNSVKVVITPESEERINNEIFYTAITRAKKDLKIYVTKDNQSQILNILSEKDDRKDIELLSKLLNV